MMRTVLVLLLSLTMAVGQSISMVAFAEMSEPASSTNDNSGSTSNGAADDADEVSEFVEDELIVLTEAGTKTAAIKEIAADAGGTLETVKTLGDGTRLAAIQTDEEDTQTAAETIADDDRVLLVQPNYIYRTADDDEHADPNIGQQWHLSAPVKNEHGEIISNLGSAEVMEAWELIEGNGIASNMPLIAVIDTGLDLGHDDLQGNIVTEKCVTINDGVISSSFTTGDEADDDDGHGTHVCGIIAAQTSNSTGVSGATNNRIKLFCIDAAMPDTLSFTTLDICTAIDYATHEGAKVINMSLGGLQRDPMIEVFVKKAWNAGVLCVCAAGNEGSRSWTSPGDIPHSISVMSHGSSGKFADSTNFGSEKDVSAPGVSIFSTIDGNQYSYMSGTSMASPVVAGLAGLLLSVDGTLNPRELKNYIYTSSGKEYYDGSTNKINGGGFGRINYKNAISNLFQTMSFQRDPEKIVLNKSSLTLYTGINRTWTSSVEFEVFPATAGKHADEIRFESSNERIVTVDSDGILTARAAGKAEITAYWTGDKSVKAKCSVTVKKPENIKITSVPYNCSGVLDDTDPMIYIAAGAYEDWGTYCDGYDIDLSAGDVITVSVQGTYMLPEILIYDSGGTLVAYRACPDADSKIGRTHAVQTKYRAPIAGTYSIYITNAEADDNNIGVQYNMNVTKEVKDGVPPPGTTYEFRGNIYVITGATTASLLRAKNAKTINLPAKVTLGGKVYTVTGIKPGAFKGRKTKKLNIKTKRLSKNRVKASLRGSKIRTVKIKVGKKKVNKKFIKKYKKIFTKKNSGKKTSLK